MKQPETSGACIKEEFYHQIHQLCLRHVLMKFLISSDDLNVSGGGILVWVRCWWRSVWRLCWGVQHEVEAGGAADLPPQPHLGAGGGQDGAEDQQTSARQGQPPVSQLAVLLLDSLGKIVLTNILRTTASCFSNLKKPNLLLLLLVLF